MDHFETLHTCCGHNEDDVHMGLLMGIELILTELQPFDLSIKAIFFCIVEYGVCVISSSYSFQWIFLKP